MSDDTLPPGLRILPRVAEACLQVLDAPIDLPLAQWAVEGLALSIESLQDRFPGTALIARRVRDSYVPVASSVAKGASILALSRRAGKHLMYLLAVNSGRSAEGEHAPDRTVLELVGAYFVIRFLSKKEPSPKAIARANAVLCRPQSRTAQSWSKRARMRSHHAATKALAQAIDLNATAAAEFGLVAPRLSPAVTDDPIAAFNRDFRCRMRVLRDFASLQEKAGAGGHGTLPADALRTEGRELVAGVEAGDHDAAMICLEVVSHLSSSLVSRLPVQVGTEPPPGALAWLDVTGGFYCHVLYEVTAKGARPASGTEHLYEVTTQVVRVSLTPPLKCHLQAAAAKRATPASCAQELLGASIHGPFSRVAGRGAYRVTARRLADSVPTVLLAQGHNRWLIVLATSSPYLVPQGRPFYGACRTQHIDTVAAAACTALDWPTPQPAQSSGLVGAFVTPRPEAIRALFNHLGVRADRAIDLGTFTGIVRCLNAHSAWLAALWGLTFALRAWLTYGLPGDQLRAGHGVVFDEKQLHGIAGAAAPVATIVRQTLRAWDTLVERACTALQALGDDASLALASRIRQWVEDPRRAPPVFEIDSALDVQPIGHLSWHVGLPAFVRLVLNFGRHFWPLQLMDRGLPQGLLELLLRHQQEGLHLGSSHRAEVRTEMSAHLRAVIDEVLEELGPRVPLALKTQ